MAGAAVAAIVSDVVSAAVVDTVTWGLVDAGLFMGAELAVGAAISGGVGMLAGGLARQALSSSSASPSMAASSVSSARAQGILINAPSNIDPIPVIYGSRTVGGTRVLLSVSSVSAPAPVTLSSTVAPGAATLIAGGSILAGASLVSDPITFPAGSTLSAGTYLSPGTILNGVSYPLGQTLLSSTSVTTVSTLGAGSILGNGTTLGDSTVFNGLGAVNVGSILTPGSNFGNGAVSVPTSTGGNELLNMVIVLGEGPISAINQVYLDGIPVTDPKFAGLVYVGKYLGTPAQAADPVLIAALPGTWTASHTLNGVAYLAIQLKYDGNVFHSLPTVTADVDGRTLYDPRTSSTAFSHNAALAIRDYLTAPIYGRGISAAAIDDASFIAAANYCDTTVSVPDGNGGTTTQARYTCDGVLDVNQTAFDNMRGLLSSCRGMLVYSGGKYRLLIDKPAPAPSPSDFGFSEANITGAWVITLTGKNNKFNRVSAGFYNPAKNWQPDIAVYDNATLRAADNGLLLESKVDVPFTANYYRATQLAQMALQQSRFGIVCKFNALQEGLRCEVGDVVPITHSTPGWVAKRFMILNIEAKDDHEVSIIAREYDDSVYSLATLTDEHLAAATTLPNPLTVATPGVPTVTESLYSTTNSVGVRARTTLEWAKTDAFAVSYQVEYQLSGAASWTVGAQTPALFTDLDDLPPGRYNFRVKAINALGKSSLYSQASKDILGLTTAPANVSGFSVVASNGFALGKWGLSPDLDVRIGGRVDVRWSPLTAGAVWENGLPVAEFNGDAVSGALPMLTGTYMVKFKDSTGHYSAAAASWALSTGVITALPNSQTLTEDPGFTGAKVNTVLIGGVLKLDSAATVGSMLTNISAWPTIGALGGVASSGTYDASTPMDFGTVGTRRFAASVNAQAFDTGDTIGARGLVSTWPSVAGVAVNDATVTLLASVSSDAVNYGAWFPMMAGDLTCRAVKFRLQFSSASPTHNVKVSQFSITATWA